jgi:hypothetical protein
MLKENKCRTPSFFLHDRKFETTNMNKNEPTERRWFLSACEGRDEY